MPPRTRPREVVVSHGRRGRAGPRTAAEDAVADVAAHEGFRGGLLRSWGKAREPDAAARHWPPWTRPRRRPHGTRPRRGEEAPTQPRDGRVPRRLREQIRMDGRCFHSARISTCHIALDTHIANHGRLALSQEFL